jgi:hypothetical protein
MSIVVVLLLCLFVGIVVGIKSKKLTITELLVCGTFGLLLGGTPIGDFINGAVLTGGTALLEALSGALQ